MWPGVKDPEKAVQTYSVPLSQVVYIEASDFQLKDSKDYYGLAPNKTVLLKYELPRVPPVPGPFNLATTNLTSQGHVYLAFRLRLNITCVRTMYSCGVYLLFQGCGKGRVGKGFLTSICFSRYSDVLMSISAVLPWSQIFRGRCFARTFPAQLKSPSFPFLHHSSGGFHLYSASLYAARDLPGGFAANGRCHGRPPWLPGAEGAPRHCRRLMRRRCGMGAGTPAR